jgi:hypothetical protein
MMAVGQTDLHHLSLVYIPFYLEPLIHVGQTNSIAAKPNSFFDEVGDMALFSPLIFFRKYYRYCRKELLRQCYLAGNRLFYIVGVTGFIFGISFYITIETQ